MSVAYIVGAGSIGFTAGGPAFAITLTLLTPTFQEFGRRQAKLSVAADTQDDDGSILPAALAPWPLDHDRIVANEIAAARQLMTAVEKMPRLTPLFVGLTSYNPSQRAIERAHDAFDTDLGDFETKLRDWNTRYSQMAQERARTFDLALSVTNAHSGAYAESVKVVIDLPPTVSVTNTHPQMPMPPERPAYEPPRSLDSLEVPGISEILRERITLARPAQQVSAPEVAWRSTNNGRRLETSIGAVHPDQTVAAVPTPHLLAAIGGRHEINWRAYTPSARRAAEGTLTLFVPPALDAPAFGRLRGVLTYPDVPLVDEHNVVTHSARTTDPPLHPPTPTDTDLLASVRHAHSVTTWKALGLEPTTDEGHPPRG